MKALWKNYLVMLLLLAVVVPPLSLAVAPAQEAEAIDIKPMAVCVALELMGIAAGAAGGIIGVAGAIFSVPTSETNIVLHVNLGTTAGSTLGNMIRECIIDPLLWELKQKLISELTEEIVTWTETGFTDQFPMGIREPVVWFKQVEVWAVEKVLFDTNITTRLCEPWQQNTVMRIYNEYMTPKYSTQGRQMCTHAAAGVNWNTLVEGGNLSDPSQGFPKFFSILDDANNPYGAYVNLESETAARTYTALSAEAMQLNYGDGFHSDYCDYIPIVPGYDGTCTPGQVVVDQLEDWLGGPLAELEVADEFSEIVNGLMAGMVRDLLTVPGNELFRGPTNGFGSNWGQWDPSRAAVDTQTEDWQAQQNNDEEWIADVPEGDQTVPNTNTGSGREPNTSVMEVVNYVNQILDRYDGESVPWGGDSPGPILTDLREVRAYVQTLDPSDPDFADAIEDARDAAYTYAGQLNALFNTIDG